MAESSTETLGEGCTLVAKKNLKRKSQKIVTKELKTMKTVRRLQYLNFSPLLFKVNLAKNGFLQPYFG